MPTPFRHAAAKTSIIAALAVMIGGVALAAWSWSAMKPDPRPHRAMSPPPSREKSRDGPGEKKLEFTAADGAEHEGAPTGAPTEPPTVQFDFPKITGDSDIASLLSNVESGVAGLAVSSPAASAGGGQAQAALASATRGLLDPILYGAPGRILETFVALGAQRPEDAPEDSGPWAGLARFLKGASIDVSHIRIERPEEESPFGGGDRREESVLRRAEPGETPESARGSERRVAKIFLETTGMFPDIDGYESRKMSALNVVLPVLPAGAKPDEAAEVSVRLVWEPASSRWIPAGFALASENPAAIQKFAQAMAESRAGGARGGAPTGQRTKETIK